MLRREKQRAPRRGVHLVEFALVAPIFFLVLFGIIDYARFIYYKQIVNHAAREGARYAIVHTYDKNEAEVKAYTTTQLMGLTTQLGAVVSLKGYDPETDKDLTSFADAQFNQQVVVTITGTFKPAVPSLLMLVGKTIPVNCVATMYSEAN